MSEARAVLDRVPAGQHRVVSALIATNLAPDNENTAHEQWRVAEQLRGRFPKTNKLMNEAEDDVLAHMSSPRQHRTKIHSTNPLEHLNGEIKRRTVGVGIFPNDAAIYRLVGAQLLELNDEWELQRRYITLETLAQLGHSANVSVPAVAA